MLSVYIWLISMLLVMTGVLSEERGNTEFQFHQNDYKMEFEHGDLISYNKQLIQMVELRSFKYNRTCAAVNITFEYKVDIGNDIEIIYQAYIFLSNEYRLFPIRFETNFCEDVAKNHYGFTKLTQCGNFTGCPIFKGRRIHICNFTPDESQLPPLIPNGRYMLELQGLYKSTEIFVIRGYGKIYRPIAIPKK